jgi:hypothetical protein
MPQFFEGYLPSVVVASSLLVGCAAGSNGGAGPIAAPAPAAPAVCATFYADAQLKGTTLVSVGPADDSPTVPPTFNDVMSSVAVTPGCTVLAYADGNYGGQEVTFAQTAQAR